MIHFVLLCYLLFPHVHPQAAPLLEALDHPLYFRSSMTTRKTDVINGSVMKKLLDWYVVRDASELGFRVATLLQTENMTHSEHAEPSLVALGHVATRCKPVSMPSSAPDAASVALQTSPRTIRFFYICSGWSSATLRAVVAHWREGTLETVVDEPVLSLGAARGWHLPISVPDTPQHLLYVLAADGKTTAVLIEADESPTSAQPTRITTLRLPQKSAAGDTRLVSSCYLPSVGLSGLVHYSETDGHSHFELHRVFSSAQSAELLLETSTNIFTELSVEERLHCSLSSRVTFTDCSLTFSNEAVSRVDVTVTALVESPVGSGGHTVDEWILCGKITLSGNAVVKESGLRIQVAPLRRERFTPARTTLEHVARLGSNGSITGHMRRCIFYHAGGATRAEGGGEEVVNCSSATTHFRSGRRGVSKSCVALRVWWRQEETINGYLCNKFGLSTTELSSVFFVLFTSLCGLQLTAYFFCST